MAALASMTSRNQRRLADRANKNANPRIAIRDLLSRRLSDGATHRQSYVGVMEDVTHLQYVFFDGGNWSCDCNRAFDEDEEGCTEGRYDLEVTDTKGRIWIGDNQPVPLRLWLRSPRNNS